jgi:uncharacterized protein YggE
MKKLMLMLIGATIVLQAIAGPELSGTPDELTAHLGSLPGQITLSGEAKLKVEADRADVILKLRNTDRSFKNALVQNQQMRAEIMANLKTSGLPAERIHMSRFSTTPTQGYFSSKVKAYEVESRVTIHATSEKEVQAIAALIDERDGVSLLSLNFNNDQKDTHTAQVLQQALAKVNRLKALYERELGITLVARAVGPQSGPSGRDLMREHSSARKEVSGISSGWALPEASVVLHALEQRGPELTQFDQVVYTATVTVTFDVMTADKK